jgi:plasmid stabilization system protein ParE
MHEVVFSPQAIDDLVGQALFILEQSGNPQTAQAHIDKIRTFLEETLPKSPTPMTFKCFFISPIEIYQAEGQSPY